MAHPFHNRSKKKKKSKKTTTLKITIKNELDTTNGEGGGLKITRVTFSCLSKMGSLNKDEEILKKSGTIWNLESLTEFITVLF